MELHGLYVAQCRPVVHEHLFCACMKEQGRSTKIKTGQAIDDAMQGRGVWGHASQENVLNLDVL